jgi:hypothetical protein
MACSVTRKLSSGATGIRLSDYLPRMLFDAYVETIGDRSAVYIAAHTLCGGEVALYPGSFLDGAPLGVWPRVIFETMTGRSLGR